MPSEIRMAILDDEGRMIRNSGEIPIESGLLALPWGLISVACPRHGRGISIGPDAVIKIRGAGRVNGSAPAPRAISLGTAGAFAPPSRSFGVWCEWRRQDSPVDSYGAVNTIDGHTAKRFGNPSRFRPFGWERTRALSSR